MCGCFGGVTNRVARRGGENNKKNEKRKKMKQRKQKKQPHAMRVGGCTWLNQRDGVRGGLGVWGVVLLLSCFVPFCKTKK